MTFRMKVASSCHVILANFVQPSSGVSAREAAQAIADQLRETNSSDCEEFLWEFWGSVNELAQKISADDPSQDRIIELVRQLQQLPPTTITIWGNDTRLWTDLPLMGPAIREAWQGPDPTTPQHWVNLNAFLARLLAAKIGGWEAPTYAIWALRDALEEEPASPPALWEAHISAATQWIEYAGCTLLSESLAQGGKDEDIGRITKPGKLFQGPGGLTLDRWLFWTARFKEIAGLLGSDIVGRMADRTAAHMAGLGTGIQ